MRLQLNILDRDGLPPCHAVTIGKLEFRRYTTVPSRVGGLPDMVHMGAVGEYSEADIAEFRDRVQHFVVRWGWRERQGVPQLWAAEIHDRRVTGWFPVPERDEPLERYLLVQEIATGVPASIGAATPEQVEALAAARASEDRARREDPTDGQRRAAHGRAKRAGEGVEA